MFLSFGKMFGVVVGIVFLGLFVSVGEMTDGIDMSTYGSVSIYECLRDYYSFAIPRCYQSSGKMDPNCASNIDNARAANFPYVDAYMFPCYPCGNPTSQMDTLVKGLSGLDYGTIWLDVEVYQWSSSQASNQQFIESLIQEGKKKGQTLGIYSSYYSWESVVGLDYCYPANEGLGLWYADYDGTTSFNDYKEFGCWPQPNIKQYHGTTTVCGLGVDLSWYP